MFEDTALDALTVRKNLRAVIDSRFSSQEAFGRAVGVSQGAVSQWLKSSCPSMVSIRKIANAMNLTLEDLVSDDKGFYAKLHGLATPVKPTSSLVPLLGSTHMGSFADEEECDRTVEVPASVAEAHPGCFCVHADGDCMDNRYPSDCVLLIDPHMEPFDGCAVLAETEQYQSIVRKFSRGSKSLMLSADSHRGCYDDIIIKADDAPVKVKGVVVWYQAEGDVR